MQHALILYQGNRIKTEGATRLALSSAQQTQSVGTNRRMTLRLVAASCLLESIGLPIDAYALPSTGSISYVKDHGLLTYAAYRIQHLESRCKDTTFSEFIERFCYFSLRFGSFCYFLLVSVTFLLQPTISQPHTSIRRA